MSIPVRDSDFLIIGSGIAGLTTALKAGARGSVTVLTKGSVKDSNTVRAQGGIATAMGPDDSPLEHFQDTLRAGHQLSQPEAATVLVEEGPRQVQHLIDWGARFDTDAEGQLAFGKEGAHSKHRIVHARGDGTGAEVIDVLVARALERDNIEILEHTFAVDLLMADGRCIGCLAVLPDGSPICFTARAVIVATGGCGRVYRYTTNPPIATGDGLAMAARRGIPLMDMEFFQFHPTALAFQGDDPLMLVSEAVRGEGAHLINDTGAAFMETVHPLKDLAPRDVVARAIFYESAAGRRVFLDISAIGSRFPARFPAIYEACIQRGIDPTVEPIPVTPAAHFMMGGIRTDTFGKTSVAGLYAVGEAACTGVHGANRLASNSLLEGLVFAERVVQSLAEEHSAAVKTVPTDELERFDRLWDIRSRTDRSRQSLPAPSNPMVSLDRPTDPGPWIEGLRQVMWDFAGIVRDRQGLTHALEALTAIEKQAPKSAWTLHNMITTGKLIIRAALMRQESRGAHYRADYPDEVDEWKTKRVIL